MGGDWNCIISEKDSSNPKNSCFSKNLKNIVNELKFKDIHNLVTKIPEYTYIKSNYACRLDRIYAIDFVKGISSSKTLPVSFSDHCCFYFDLTLHNMFPLGKSYWKLNCSVLKESGVNEDFATLWENLKREKIKYSNASDW